MSSFHIQTAHANGLPPVINPRIRPFLRTDSTCDNVQARKIAISLCNSLFHHLAARGSRRPNCPTYRHLSLRPSRVLVSIQGLTRVIGGWHRGTLGLRESSRVAWSRARRRFHAGRRCFISQRPGGPFPMVRAIPEWGCARSPISRDHSMFWQTS